MTPNQREVIARLGNVIKALANYGVQLYDTIILTAYDISLKYKVQHPRFTHYIATSPNPQPDPYPKTCGMSHTIALTLNNALIYTIIKFCRNIVRLSNLQAQIHTSIPQASQKVFGINF